MADVVGSGETGGAELEGAERGRAAGVLRQGVGAPEGGEMVADVTRKMLGKIPVSKYPCAWCPSQHFSPEELNWVDDADDFICSACIQRNYSSKRRETGRVVKPT